MENVYDMYKGIANYYKLSNLDNRKLWSLIKPICGHPEFIKRCQAPYFHHGTKTLGEHILSDTVLTYKMIKILKKSKYYHKIIKLETAVYIAMFHDLYEIPWQNACQKKKFCNLHGFVHPIEAIVNAISWFPEYFKNKEKALIIIDGVVHHMYPLAVRSIDNKDLELNNQAKFDALPKQYKKMIIESSNISRFGHFSLRKTFFIEGRILSKADKSVAFKKEFKTLNAYMALVNGRNKALERL